ncbi:hypothetical protein [Nostoc sp. CMAA1605]|nr:hypothetical protein [Nostoc sp. CMAA1605]
MSTKLFGIELVRYTSWQDSLETAIASLYRQVEFEPETVENQ